MSPTKINFPMGVSWSVIHVFGKTSAEVPRIGLGLQDVDVVEVGFHRVPCPPTLLRSFGAAAFARRWLAIRSSQRDPANRPYFARRVAPCYVGHTSLFAALRAKYGRGGGI